jgi:hypothetical protein
MHLNSTNKNALEFILSGFQNAIIPENLVILDHTQKLLLVKSPNKQQVRFEFYLLDVMFDGESLHFLHKLEKIVLCALFKTMFEVKAILLSFFYLALVD